MSKRTAQILHGKKMNEGNATWHDVIYDMMKKGIKESDIVSRLT